MTADRHGSFASAKLHFIVRPALAAHQRIDLVDLREQPRPCPLARVDGDFLAVIKGLESRILWIRGFIQM